MFSKNCRYHVSSLLASLVGGTKTQGKDASEGNREAVKRLGMPQRTKGYSAQV